MGGTILVVGATGMLGEPVGRIVCRPQKIARVMYMGLKPIRCWMR